MMRSGTTSEDQDGDSYRDRVILEAARAVDAKKPRPPLVGTLENSFRGFHGHHQREHFHRVRHVDILKRLDEGTDDSVMVEQARFASQSA